MHDPKKRSIITDGLFGITTLIVEQEKFLSQKV